MNDAERAVLRLPEPLRANALNMLYQATTDRLAAGKPPFDPMSFVAGYGAGFIEGAESDEACEMFEVFIASRDREGT